MAAAIEPETPDTPGWFYSTEQKASHTVHARRRCHSTPPPVRRAMFTRVTWWLPECCCSVAVRTCGPEDARRNRLCAMSVVAICYLRISVWRV